MTYIAALHGNPYDGHTLKDTVAGVKSITGLEPERIFVDKGYRGHDYDKPVRVFRSGQKRGLTPLIKRQLRRRSAIEPVIGHMKEDGRLGRNFLKDRHGDRLNAILAGVGQNVRLLLRWFRLLFCLVLAWLYDAVLLRRVSRPEPQPSAKAVSHGRLCLMRWFRDGALDVGILTRRGVRVATARIDDLLVGVELVEHQIEGLELQVLSASGFRAVDARPALVVEVRLPARQFQRLARPAEENGGEPVVGQIEFSRDEIGVQRCRPTYRAFLI